MVNVANENYPVHKLGCKQRLGTGFQSTGAAHMDLLHGQLNQKKVSNNRNESPSALWLGCMVGLSLLFSDVITPWLSAVILVAVQDLFGQVEKSQI